MSLERVKVLAPAAAATRGAAVTQPDYRALVNSFSDPTYGQVAQGYAAQIRSSGQDAPTIQYTSAVTDAMVALKAFVDGLTAAGTGSLTIQSQALLDALTAIDAEVETLAGTNGLSTDIRTSASVLEQGGNSNLAQGSVIAAQSDLHGSVIVQLEALMTDSSDNGTFSDNSAEMTVLITQLDGIVKTQIVPAAATVTGEGTALLGGVEALEVTALAVESSAGVIGTSSTAAQAALDSINADIVLISTAVDAAKATVDSNIAALLTHLDGKFNSDCQANEVNVSVLALGADGFYTGPSTGLIAAVQVYFDEIKEVTQHVDVISGVSGLLAANITVKARYTGAFQASEVRSSIETRLDSLLRGREYAVPLYLSAPDKKSGIYDTLSRVTGLGFVNVEITSPSDRLDADGNLVPLELEIVTKGTLTIEVEQA